MKPKRSTKQFLKSEFNPWSFHPVFWSPKHLIPDIVTSHLDTINIEELKWRGIRGIAIDYDGVIAPYHSFEIPKSTKLQAISKLREHFEVVILTNRQGILRESLEQTLSHLPLVSNKRMKPHPDPYQAVAEYLGMRLDQIAIIEDRLVTGTSGAKRLGMYAIWIHPAEKEGVEPFNLRIYRFTEELFLRLYQFFCRRLRDRPSQERYFAVDLHFHLGTKPLLKQTLSAIAKEVDCVALVGRGHRFANNFEYNFDSFIAVLQIHQISHTRYGKVVVEVHDGTTHLVVIKGQELYTREGFDVVVIGVPEDFSDDIPHREIINRSQQGITILSTPFAVPNTLKSRSKDDSAVERLASVVDCVEEYNQSLFFTRANRKARLLVQKTCKPGVAVSDFHKYSSRNTKLKLSHVRIPREIISTSDKQNIVEHIKSAILQNKHQNVSHWSPQVLWEVLSLRLDQIQKLYYGNPK